VRGLFLKLRFFCWLLLAVAGCRVSVALGAEPITVRLLVSEGNVFAARTATQLETLLHNNDIDVVAEPATGSQKSRRLVVAIGAGAWRKAVDTLGPDVALLGVMVPQQTLEQSVGRRARLAGVILAEPPPSRLLNLIQLALPYRRQVGLIAGPQLTSQLGRIEGAAAERGLHLGIEKVTQEAEVGPAVERLVQAGTALLALPDGTVHTANTVQPLLLISYRNGVPVVAYSEAYLRAGAALATYSTPEQLARQSAEMVIAYREGKGALPIQSPRYFSVGVNQAVVRSLDLSLPSPEDIGNRLRQMKE